MKKIITIGREFGSGGREIGRRLAEELNIEYYDKEILTAIAQKTQMSKEYVQEIVEGKPHSLFPITVGQSIFFADNFYLQQENNIYSAQSEIIKELAQKSDCVIVGRCADYILKEFNPYRIFVYADIDTKVKRCLAYDKFQNETEKSMKKHILKIDKNRANYYDFYTGLKWGEKTNYDLMINAGGHDAEQIAKAIASMLK